MLQHYLAFDSLMLIRTVIESYDYIFIIVNTPVHVQVFTVNTFVHVQLFTITSILFTHIFIKSTIRTGD